MNDENKKILTQESIDAAKAQAYLEADKKSRAEKCQRFIEAALKECDCNLVAVPFIKDGLTLAQIQIVPK